MLASDLVERWVALIASTGGPDVLEALLILADQVIE
jgi:hypothetical protein